MISTITDRLKGRLRSITIRTKHLIYNILGLKPLGSIRGPCRRTEAQLKGRKDQTMGGGGGNNWRVSVHALSEDVRKPLSQL